MTKTHHPTQPLGCRRLAGQPDDGWSGCWNCAPDSQPAPGSTAALAARASSRQSVKAAADELDFLRLSRSRRGLLVPCRPTTPGC